MNLLSLSSGVVQLAMFKMSRGLGRGCTIYRLFLRIYYNYYKIKPVTRKTTSKIVYIYNIYIFFVCGAHELLMFLYCYSSLFPDVVNCMQTDNLELKKLVYLYLMNYAKSQPDMAIMAVNTFVKVTYDFSLPAQHPNVGQLSLLT
jgi:hypothetical protein